MASERVPTFHPHPSRPKLRLPPGSWDTHCHVLGPTDKYPFAATTTINPADAPKETLFALHALLGIERCVIVQTATHGMDNRVTEDALAAKGGAYLGVALLPVTVSDAELRRLDGRGFRGVRFNFMRHLHQAATLDEVMALTPRLADIGWHLQVHMDGALHRRHGGSARALAGARRHRSHRPRRRRAGTGTGAVSAAAAADAERQVLGEGQRLRSHQPHRAALRRRGAVRAQAGRPNIPTAWCGAPTGRIRITRGRSRTRGNWSTSSPRWRRPMNCAAS